MIFKCVYSADLPSHKFWFLISTDCSVSAVWKDLSAEWPTCFVNQLIFPSQNITSSGFPIYVPISLHNSFFWSLELSIIFNLLIKIFSSLNRFDFCKTTLQKQWKQWQTLFWGAPESLQMVTAAMELKKRLLLGRKVMTNLDSILKSRDITLPTKVRLVEAMIFPVVMCGWESWTIKKAEGQRIDAFELWCWRRLMRVPWTARSPS